MMNPPRTPRLIGAALLGLALLTPVWAQQERSWTRLFGSRSADKNTAKPAPLDPKRQVEIQVEIAWLADPVTFPYYLEAHVGSSGLEVRGYVPNKAVRDHALNLARVYSALPVTDGLKEHTSLLVRPSLMSPPHLQNSVAAALREALPKGYQHLQVQCGKDGRVAVSGQVATPEERLIVSHALRRLHGCTSVQNMTQSPIEIAAAKKTPPKGPITAQTTANKAAPQRPSFGTATTSTEAVQPARNDKPAAEPRPLPLTSGPELPIPTVEGPFKNEKTPTEPTTKPEKTTVVEEPMSPPAPLTPELAARIKKRIAEACPGVKEVKVEVVSMNELRVEVTTRTEDQVTTFATQIYGLSEMQMYRADLQFKVVP
jgi:hypothetical protein